MPLGTFIDLVQMATKDVKSDVIEIEACNKNALPAVQENDSVSE